MTRSRAERETMSALDAVLELQDYRRGARVDSLICLSLMAKYASAVKYARWRARAIDRQQCAAFCHQQLVRLGYGA